MTPASSSILAALEAQLGCYQRLAKLAELQHEHVQQGQTEGLIEVLEQRRRVLLEVAALEDHAGWAKKRWSAFVAELPTDSRAAAEETVSQIRRLLEQIMIADGNDVLVLQQRQLSLGRPLKGVSVERTVNRTYAVNAYARPAVLLDC